MGETRVDLTHLLEDLRDAYPGALEETILTEIIANSLDSGATRITLITDPAGATLTALDDGSGMIRRDLRHFHDLAASTKSRGQGIGFAGVGIKLGLLACEDVVTETRRASHHVATSWHLASRHKAPWRWIEPPGIVTERGTAVRLHLKNPLSPLLEPGYLENTIQRHFQPLLDDGFQEMLAGHYPRGVRFVVDGREIPRVETPADRSPIAVRIGRKRKPSAAGYLARSADAFGEDQRGLAVSTLGKVIKRGWDWLGFSPAAPDLVGGLIEVPALADCLTLNKADFLRTGPRGATYLAYRKAVQEAVAAQLGAWGESREPEEEARRRKTRPLERDLESVLVELADDFPLLASLVERYRGGQKKLPIGRPDPHGEPLPVATHPGELPLPDGSPPVTDAPSATDGGEAPQLESGDGRSVEPSESDQPPTEPPEPDHPVEPPSGQGLLPGTPGRKRPMRYGLAIQFESIPDSDHLGRLVESTVWVNDAHPAYKRAVASRSEGYHLALTVAMALGSLAVEASQVQAFVSAFLARWGESLDKPRPRGRGARPR
ncbi:MAG: ATP-binding protein [Deltaproteobacteria bacterium]|nr:ATP-binding protein [Deltaproteobacteria bacterium]